MATYLLLEACDLLLVTCDVRLAAYGLLRVTCCLLLGIQQVATCDLRLATEAGVATCCSALISLATLSPIWFDGSTTEELKGLG